MVSITVLCRNCGKVFWKGTLIDWTFELRKKEAPLWFLESQDHEKKTQHEVVVEYPSGLHVSINYGLPY